MKEIKRLAITFLLASILFITLFSCNRTPKDPQYMVFDDIEYITEFPQTFTLQNIIEPDIDVIGIKNFAIYDSLIMFATKTKTGIFSIYSLLDYSHLGSFLNQGEGPFEFIMPPSLTREMRIINNDSNLFAYVYDFQKGRMLKANISNLINSKDPDLEEYPSTLPPFSFNFIMLDSVSYFCKELKHMDTRQVRYILNNGNEISIPAFKKLNPITIRPREDFNILTTITKMNYDKKLIVEMPVGLNYINIYSTDTVNIFEKTICVGEKLFDIEKIQDTRRWRRIYTYADLRIFSNFFGVVRIDEDDKTHQTKRKKLPSILLFNFSGKPLAELKLNKFITSFDIDFNAGELYTFDNQTDEFFKYDIKDILNKL